MMREHADSNPQGLHSMFGTVANSKGFDLGSMLGGSSNQQQQKKQQQGGGIGDLLGRL
jgi:hypothetical protein